MTIEEFAQFLAGTVLLDVALRGARVERPTNAGDDFEGLMFGERADLISAEEERAVIDATLGVRCLEGPTDDETSVATLEITLRVTYKTPRRMDDEVFAQFQAVTLRLHTVPFAREWFRDMSGRMGLRPIVLPLAIAHPAAMPSGQTKVRRKRTSRAPASNSTSSD